MRSIILKRTRGCLARIMVAGVSLVITLLVLEGVVRGYYPQQLILLRPDIWQPAEVVGWRHAPQLQTTVNTGERTVHVYTDAYGYRVGDVSAGTIVASDDTFNILALGDSFVEAFQVEYDVTFVAQLSTQLAASLDRNVVVTNTGVSGWDPNHYRLEAHTAFARDTYDLALVFLYMPNDVTSYMVNAWPPRDYAARHTFGWPQRWTQQDIVTQWLYPLNDTLETRSHLYIWARNQARVLQTRLGLSPYYFPWPLRVENANSSVWATTAENCAALAAHAARRDIPVLFVLLPGNIQVDDTILDWYLDTYDIDPQQIDWDQPGRILTRELTARDLIVFDATPGLRAAHAAGEAALYGRIDAHFSPVGHEVMARLLADWLLTQQPKLLTG